MLQIYNEKCIDLLGGSDDVDLQIKMGPRGTTIVDGLTQRAATSATEAQSLLALGTSKRRVAATKMNAESSRSHLVFTLNGIVCSRVIGKTMNEYGL